MRYQVVYNKRGFPLTVWFDDLNSARKFADGLIKAGYSVSIWEQSAAGARKISA